MWPGGRGMLQIYFQIAIIALGDVQINKIKLQWMQKY